MSAVGDKALAVARRWIGTPYLHQASVSGSGADCLGLLRGIWRELYGGEPEMVPAYSADWSEAGRDERLWQAARRHLVEKPLSDCASGDVLLFRMNALAVAKHLGVAGRVGADASFVHAYSRHGVVESPLSEAWARRVVARFEFPERGAQWPH